MKHQMGDLLWIPQATMLYRGPNNPMAVKFNPKPEIGIFLKEIYPSEYALVQVDGQEWIVEQKHIKKLKIKEEQC